jgi:hypothetical protein
MSVLAQLQFGKTHDEGHGEVAGTACTMDIAAKKKHVAAYFRVASAIFVIIHAQVIPDTVSL